VTSSANEPHQKHAKLMRPEGGEFGRNELAIVGTTCNNIQHLAYQIISQLTTYKIAYADADHKGAELGRQRISAINNNGYAEYINKIFFTRIDINKQPNAFQKRALLNDCDLVLVNGNHFTASRQIMVLDPAKSLQNKLDRLTNVQLILLKDYTGEIPDYLINHLPNFSSIPTLSFDDTYAIIAFVSGFMQQQMPAVNGLVLSGGKSTRMGSDKGSLNYHGIPQRRHVFNLLAAHCKAVFVSCNGEQAKNIADLPVMQDSFLGLGPLGGILSAFQQNPNVAWLTIACDLPYLNAETIDYLITHRNPSKMATAFLDADGVFPEPLVTIWEPRAYPILLQFLSQGYSCPRKALINSDVEILKAPDAFAFKNVNTTEEYNEVVTILHNKHNS
jgi:molybdenum cofactor guanylyltransferase